MIGFQIDLKNRHHVNYD